jgi:hypothetical protein
VKPRHDKTSQESGYDRFFQRNGAFRRSVKAMATRVSCSVTGKAGGVARVVYELVNQIYVECGRTVH